MAKRLEIAKVKCDDGSVRRGVVVERKKESPFTLENIAFGLVTGGAGFIATVGAPLTEYTVIEIGGKHYVGDEVD